MKFQKWHFGLISLLLILLVSILVWNWAGKKINSNAVTKNSSNSQSALPTSSEIDETKLLFFYSNSCPHCQKMKPIVSDLQSQGYQIVWVDVTQTQNKSLNEKYQISGVPTFVRSDGQKLIGEQDKQTLENFLKDYKK